MSGKADRWVNGHCEIIVPLKASPDATAKEKLDEVAAHFAYIVEDDHDPNHIVTLRWEDETDALPEPTLRGAIPAEAIEVATEQPNTAALVTRITNLRAEVASLRKQVDSKDRSPRELRKENDRLRSGLERSKFKGAESEAEADRLSRRAIGSEWPTPLEYDPTATVSVRPIATVTVSSRGVIRHMHPTQARVLAAALIAAADEAETDQSDQPKGSDA